MPLAGVGVVIPFGNRIQNCDKLVAIATAQHRLLAAQEMFEMGFIDADQMDSIAKKVYAVLNDF